MRICLQQFKRCWKKCGTKSINMKITVLELRFQQVFQSGVEKKSLNIPSAGQTDTFMRRKKGEKISMLVICRLLFQL